MPLDLLSTVLHCA